MRAKNIFVLIAITILLMVTAAGCGNEASERSQGGKTLNVGWAQWPTNLDPGSEYNGWFTVEFGLGETLVKTSKDMTIEPWLAESWTRVDDTTWKIKIRDNVQFHNGKKVDGAAVKASLERTIEMNKRAPGLLDIASIDVEGDEVTIKNNNPNSSFITTLADPFAVIVDAAAADEMGDGFQENPVLTGPFKLDEYVKDERVVVVRNEDYWGEKAKLEEVVFKHIPDANTRMMALQAGEIQVADKIPAEEMVLQERNENLRILSESSVRVHMLVFNLNKPGLNDINVRKAINLAINREDLADKIMSGSGIPAVGPFPIVLPFGGSELKGYDYDLEEAEKLLDEAGWKPGPDGIRQKGSVKLNFTFLSYKSRPELPVIMETIQSQLKAIGIKIEIINVEEMITSMRDGAFDAGILSFSTAPTGDPQYMMETIFMTGGDNNLGGYINEKLDELGKKLQFTFVTEERETIAKEAQQVIIDDAAFAFLVYPKIITAIHKDVEGLVITPTEYYFLDSQVGLKKIG